MQAQLSGLGEERQDVGATEAADCTRVRLFGARVLGKQLFAFEALGVAHVAPEEAVAIPRKLRFLALGSQSKLRHHESDCVNSVEVESG